MHAHAIDTSFSTAPRKSGLGYEARIRVASPGTLFHRTDYPSAHAETEICEINVVM